MARKLSAIEIAEGALLADISVIFHIVALYLPVGGEFFRLLVPIPITIVVLRRGVYAGIMSYVVAMFTAGLITGHNIAGGVMLTGGAGLFLGITMKYRMHDIPLVLLGATGAAALLYALIVLVPLLFGLPASTLIIGLKTSYDAMIGVLNFTMPQLGLQDIWQHDLYPTVNTLATIGLTYWWALYYILLWVFCIPIVIVVYYITNLFIRLLGYDVRPFPGGRLNRLIVGLLRLIVRLTRNTRPGKYQLSRSLMKEFRRRGIERRGAET